MYCFWPHDCWRNISRNNAKCRSSCKSVVYRSGIIASVKFAQTWMTYRNNPKHYDKHKDDEKHHKNFRIMKNRTWNLTKNTTSIIENIILKSKRQS